MRIAGVDASPRVLLWFEERRSSDELTVHEKTGELARRVEAQPMEGWVESLIPVEHRPAGGRA